MKLDFKSLSAVILGVLGLSEWSKVEDKNSMRERETKNLPLPLFFAVCWVILRPVWHRHRNSLKLCRRNSVTKTGTTPR